MQAAVQLVRITVGLEDLVERTLGCNEAGSVVAQIPSRAQWQVRTVEPLSLSRRN